MVKSRKNEYDFNELYNRIRSNNNKINQAEFTFMKRRLKEDIKNGEYDDVILGLLDHYMTVRNSQLVEVYKITEIIFNTDQNGSIDDLLSAMDLFNQFISKTLYMTETFSDGDRIIEQHELYDMDYSPVIKITNDMNLLLIAYGNGLSSKLKPSVIESKQKCACNQLANECMKIINYLFTNLIREYEDYVFSELLDLQNDIFEKNTLIRNEIMNRLKAMADTAEKQSIEKTIENYKKPLFTDNYKKLNAILKSKNYIEVRQRGSHKIFSNGKYSIPVPQHRIGKGLFNQINKEIVL